MLAFEVFIPALKSEGHGRAFSRSILDFTKIRCAIRENVSLLAGGYWVFHGGKPVPFGNRAPSWIFQARAPGYERARAKIEEEGRGREGKNRLLED